ncbi:DUF559 domain-containing protein [Sphingomonas naphthae]|uniref:DUF559 domain-containing protein n=1 Tax=Sphingomonas naphthae TaxID=1813468 RepID=A0ABY7TPU2_9SPHN|nr:DUF559 domain-containing protein [Sphingomonas naphthae]WCT75258.1 DUF559 domain-containing protein [Sphingomonas naphthae]
MTRARRLRRDLSLPEGLLWQRLRRRAGSAKFRRQHPLGPYIIDFYCAAAKLAIEVDGEAHNRGTRPQRDAVRDDYIRARGLDLLHIRADEVLADPDAIAGIIIRTALPLHRPTGGPPPHAPHGEELHGAV